MEFSAPCAMTLGTVKEKKDPGRGVVLFCFFHSVAGFAHKHRVRRTKVCRGRRLIIYNIIAPTMGNDELLLYKWGISARRSRNVRRIRYTPSCYTQERAAGCGLNGITIRTRHSARVLLSITIYA